MIPEASKGVIHNLAALRTLGRTLETKANCFVQEGIKSRYKKERLQCTPPHVV
jgi:hypothetical protein